MSPERSVTHVSGHSPPVDVCSAGGFIIVSVDGGISPLDVAAILKDKRQAVLDLAAQHGAFNVRVFGSVARGEATAESDIDFLVELEPGRSLFDLGGLLMDLQDLLGCKVDVGTSKMLKASIREQVLKEAIPL